MRFLRPALPCVQARTHSVAPLRRLTTETASGDSSPTAPLVSNIDKIVALGRRLSRQAEQSEDLRPGKDRLSGLSFWADLRPGLAVKQQLPQLHAPFDSDEKPTSMEVPKTRTMKDTFIEFDLPFESDKSLVEIYAGAHTSIRLGRLMEDFDTLAGTIAYKHCLPDGASRKDAAHVGIYLVTAAVDRLDMLRPLDPVEPEDLRLSGHVCNTTSSTLEVFVRMESISRRLNLDKNPETLLLGRFTMACRDAKTGRKREVPQLVTHGEDEKALQAMAVELRSRKREDAKRSLESTPPNAEESALIHRLFMQRTKDEELPPRAIWMSETRQMNATICHPQERNVHNKIFGGWLMRLAHETAYATASRFASAPVRFLALDELSFKAPVEIGSVLQLESEVSFAPVEEGHKSFHVSVDASTLDLKTGARVRTNTFHYTWATDQPLDRFVLPKTYRDAMRWLEALRRRETGLALRRMYDVK